MAALSPLKGDRRTAPRRLDDRSFSFLANLLPQMVWTATPDGSFDYVNQRWCDYTGQELQEALGHGWESVLHPDDLPAMLKAWKQANVSGMGQNVEHRLRHRSGEYRLHVTRYAPQLGADGNVFHWFGTSMDIQDERDNAMRLAGAEKRAALSDLAHELAHDLNNPLAALMNLIYIAKDKAESEEGKQLISHAEEQVERIAGLVHSILVLEKNAAGGGDKYAGILDAARLRRQKQEYEAALHLASIVESAQDAIYSKKIDGTIMAWNSAAEHLFGYNAKEIIGRNITLLMPRGREDEFPVVTERLRRGEQIEQYESERLTKDGRLIRVWVTMSPVHNGAGEVVGVSAIARKL